MTKEEGGGWIEDEETIVLFIDVMPFGGESRDPVVYSTHNTPSLDKRFKWCPIPTSFPLPCYCVRREHVSIISEYKTLEHVITVCEDDVEEARHRLPYLPQDMNLFERILDYSSRLIPEQPLNLVFDDTRHKLLTFLHEFRFVVERPSVGELRLAVRNARALKMHLYVDETVLEILARKTILSLWDQVVEMVEGFLRILYTKDMRCSCDVWLYEQLRLLLDSEASFINLLHPDFLSRTNSTTWSILLKLCKLSSPRTRPSTFFDKQELEARLIGCLLTCYLDIALVGLKDRVSKLLMYHLRNDRRR